MNRLLVASRTRTDIDLPNFLGTHEFSMVPASLFTSDGSLHHTTDKSVIASELRKLQMGKRDGANDVNIEGRKVRIIDAMATVNKNQHSKKSNTELL